MRKELPVFVKWMSFVDWLLDVTQKFPKNIRFTMTNRVENFSLDIVEDLVEARYTSRKASVLRRANLKLEKIRILLRICHEKKYLSKNSYLYAMKEMNEVGRMIGGWEKQQK